jgi:UDP-N-acetylmuramate--alanine ligase
LVYIDDYAHHPTEIDAVYQAVWCIPIKCFLVFSRICLVGLEILQMNLQEPISFNEVILMDIYPARELPIKGITSEWLLDKIDNKHKEIVSKQDLIKTILETNAQVIVTIGAGDIGASSINQRSVK